MEHEIEPSGGDHSPVPFRDLAAPEPLEAAPPPRARVLAFALILAGGLLGSLVGYGVGDLMGGSSDWAAVGALFGGLTGALGSGIVANLTLRAMGEWRSVEHPEAAATEGTDRASDEAGAGGDGPPAADDDAGQG